LSRPYGTAFCGKNSNTKKAFLKRKKRILKLNEGTITIIGLEGLKIFSLENFNIRLFMRENLFYSSSFCPKIWKKRMLPVQNPKVKKPQ
jgi:hypothetical protein